MSDFIAHVIAELDTSKAEAQLNALTSKKYKLQFDTLNASSITKDLESEMAKAGKSAGSSFSKNLSQSLSGANVSKQFSSINSSIAQTNKNLNNVNVHGLDNVIGSVTKYFSAYRLIANGLQELKNGFQLVTAVDDAMTNISYTMDVSTSQLQKFSAQAIQMAQDLHTSAKTVLEASTLYANANESIESILTKTRTATMLSNVTSMGGEKSAKTLQSIMNQFDLTQDDLLSISDTLQSVSQSMAYDFSAGIDQIASGISTSGSVAKDAGLSLQQYSSMLGTIIEQTGLGGSQVGNALKTIFTRITKASETSGTLASDISNAEASLRAVGVEVRSSSGEFRDLDSILGDLSDKWDSISDTEKSNISFEVAGTRQNNIIKSLMKSWDKYEQRVEDATNLTNSPTLANQEKYAESMTGHLEELSAAAESFWTTFIDTQSAKSAVDFLTNVIGLLEKLTSTFGSLGTIGAGMTLFSLFKNRSYFSTMASAIAESTGKFENFGAAVSMAGTDLKGFLKTPSGIATAVGAATAVIGIAVQAYQNYQRELRETREAQLEQAQAAISNADAFEDAYVLASQYAGKTSLTADEESKFKAAVEGASEALGGKSDAFDSASGSAQTYLEKLQEVEAEQVKQAKINATKERDAAEKLLKSDAYSGWSGSKVTIDLSGRTGVDEFVKAKEVLEGLMKDYIDLGTYGEELEPLNWDADTSNMDAVVDYYYQLINLQDQLADKNLTNNDIYDDSSKIIKNLKDDVDAYVKAKYDELKYSYEAKNGIPTTVDEYNKMHDSILNNIDASQEYKDVLSDMMQQDFSESIDFDAIGDSAGNAAEQIEKAAANATSSLAQMSQKAQDVVSSIKSVQDVLNAQTTGKSMSLSDWNSEELKDYRSALEYVNGSLQLNADKVNEIVKAKSEEQIAVNDANKAYAESQYLANAGEIEKLRAKIRDNTFAANENAESVQAQIEAYQAQNDTLLDTINSYDLMNASITEATSAYQNWLNAQNGSDYGDMTNDAVSAIQRIRDTYDSNSDVFGDFGSKKFEAAIDFIVPDSVDGDDLSAIESYMSDFKQYLKFDDNGAVDGLNIDKFLENSVNAGLMKYSEDDGFQILGGKKMEDFAEGLNMSSGMVQAFFDKLQLKGADFDWADEANKTIGDLGVSATEAAEKLRSIDQFKDLKIQMDVSDLATSEEKISALDATIAEMQEVKGKVAVDSSEAEYANQVIQYCITQKQMLSQPEVMQVDTSLVEGKIGEAIALFQQFQQAKEQLEAIQALGLDTTQAQANLDAVTQKIQGLDENVTATLNIDTSSVDTIQQSISNLTCEMMVKAGIDDSAIIGFQSEEHDAQGKVTWDNDTAAVDAYSAAQKAANGTVKWYNDTSLVKTTFTATGTINWTNSGGGHSLNGTAHACGTAKAGGDWGTAPGGKTLVGELGREIVVDPHTGRWYTVGDNGAEFRDIPAGAIVFNHIQSESLLENGYVAGRAAALVSGTALVTGGYKPYKPSSSPSTKKSSSKSSSSSGGSSSSRSSSGSSSLKSSSSSSSSSSEKDFEETFDWIEIAIKRISEAIDRVKVKAESAFKTLAKRNSAAADEISLITQQINTQNQAYTRYMQQANSVGLSSDWMDKVKNGTIDISTITDEDLADKIKDFQDFYEKAIETKDAVADLHEEIASLYKDKFDNVSDKYEGDLALLGHLTNVYKTGMDALQAQGYKGSTVYYKALQKAETESIVVLKEELKSMIDAYSEAMNSGEIEKGSSAWYDMQKAINSVKESIQDAELSLIQYEKSMRELNWEYFDYMEDRISNITDEADFLIDLMANGKLFDDKGQMTDTGMATMGLHGQNYNVDMAQADQYAKAIKELNAEIAKDPYNTDLIERRQELLELQRKSILAAEDEKQAMIDLVKDGIEAQLDSLKDLMDAYTDSLDSAKDLYDYQKKVKEQSDEIASLQKQLSAYAGDNSEETKATIQKIQVDLSKAMEELQETEYEQYISDQKKLLDELYTEYETILNARLDDVDALISDMIDTINANSSSIGDTIQQECANVGYTLTESMNSIWTNEGGAFTVISKYGEQFLSQNTSTLNAILGIKAYTDALIAKADAEAKAKEEATKKQTEASKPASQPSKPSNNTPSTPSKPARTDKDYYGVALAIWNGNYGWGTGNTRVSRLQAKGFDANRVQSIVNQMGREGYVRSGAWVGRYQGIRDLSPYHYNKYAVGLKNAPKAENAWVNELGSESIVKPSENAIVTHIAKGDSVLTADATRNIWDMASDPSDFISKNLFSNGVRSDVKPRVYVDNRKIGEVEFNLPNVLNYEDFMRRMQRDNKFEGMIQDMTIGIVAGKSSLAKNKYRW